MSRHTRHTNRWVYVKTDKMPKNRSRSESEEANAYFSVRAEVIGRPVTSYRVRMPDGEERDVTDDDLQFIRRERDPIETVVDDVGHRGEGATTSRHPSFGMIGISHVSGGRPIHGSKLDSHQHYVAIRIVRGAVEKHDLGRNWHFGGGDKVITVALSPARFAEFLAAPNRGEGIPCSITYHSPMPGPGMIPAWDTRDTELQRIVDRVQGIGGEAVERQRKALEGIMPMLDKLSKPRRAAILSAFNEGARALNDSAPFLVKSAVEALEHRVSEAKCEVEAFITNQVVSAGRKLLEAYGTPSASEVGLIVDVEGTDGSEV